MAKPRRRIEVIPVPGAEIKHTLLASAVLHYVEQLARESEATKPSEASGQEVPRA